MECFAPSVWIENSSCMHTFDWQYFYEDIWCAKKIYEYNPDWHWDVGSSVDGFSHIFPTQNVQPNKEQIKILYSHLQYQTYLLHPHIWRDEHQQIIKDENTLRWIEKADTIAMFEFQSERMV